MSSSKNSFLFTLIVLETVLVFLLGVLSGKISNLINFSPSFLLTSTAIGIAALCFVSYLRQKGYTSNHDPKLNAIVPVKKYLSEFTKRIPSISFHIFTQSSNATADPEDAVMTRAIVRAIAGGVILAPLFLWLQDSWYPLLFLLILIALDIFASVPLIKLPSDETGRARFWEVLMLFGFNIAVMWTIMYVVLPVLLVVCLIFGIQT